MLGRICGLLWRALLVLWIVAAVAVGVQARRAPERPLLGHLVLVVLSGSMAPTFRAGDLIVDRAVTPAAAARLRPGQVITYRLRGGLLVTHRIVAVREGPSYQTRGDANATPDPLPVRPGQVVGVYGWRVPYAGRLVLFVHRPLGAVGLLALPVAVLVGAQVWRLTAAVQDRVLPALTRR